MRSRAAAFGVGFRPWARDAAVAIRHSLLRGRDASISLGALGMIVGLGFSVVARDG